MATTKGSYICLVKYMEGSKEENSPIMSKTVWIQCSNVNISDSKRGFLKRCGSQGSDPLTQDFSTLVLFAFRVRKFFAKRRGAVLCNTECLAGCQVSGVWPLGASSVPCPPTLPPLPVVTTRWLQQVKQPLIEKHRFRNGLAWKHNSPNPNRQEARLAFTLTLERILSLIDQVVGDVNGFQFRNHREAGGKLEHRFQFFCLFQQLWVRTRQWIPFPQSQSNRNMDSELFPQRTLGRHAG